jgi:hypothetical protein
MGKTGECSTRSVFRVTIINTNSVVYTRTWASLFERFSASTEYNSRAIEIRSLQSIEYFYVCRSTALTKSTELSFLTGQQFYAVIKINEIEL